MTKGFAKTAFLASAVALLPLMGKASASDVEYIENKPAVAEKAFSEVIEDKTYSRKEAYFASGETIVIHYGKNIQDADTIARLLNERGYPAIALPGAKDDVVSLIVDKSIPLDFGQKEINDGTLGARAIYFYNDRVSPASQDLVADAT